MTNKLYAERDVDELETYYDHVSAMTSEGLHSKAAIAAELAYRDEKINRIILLPDTLLWEGLIDSPTYDLLMERFEELEL